MAGLEETRGGPSVPAPAVPGDLRQAPPPEELARRTYRAYRRRQAGELLRLLPEGAVRPLYQRAREWALERGVHDGKDPMDSLLHFCEELLPLPPFRDWLRDTSRNADAHLRQLEQGPDGHGGRDPFPLEVRTFEADGTAWHATLTLYRAEEAWRGFVAFHRGPDTPVLQTAEIFREESPAEVRARFRDFDVPALRAFLRSVRP